MTFKSPKADQSSGSKHEVMTLTDIMTLNDDLDDLYLEEEEGVDVNNAAMNEDVGYDVNNASQVF